MSNGEKCVTRRAQFEMEFLTVRMVRYVRPFGHEYGKK